MLVTAELIQEAAAEGGVAVGQIVQHRIAVEASQLLNHVARLMGVVHNAVFFALVGEHQASTQNHVIFGPGTLKAELLQLIHSVAVLDVVTVCTQQALGNATRLRRTWVDSIWINTIRRRIIKTVLLSVRGVANVFVRREDITTELQSRGHLVCRLLLEKQKTKNYE